MNKKISIILIIFIVILFSFLLIKTNKVYAIDMDKYIEQEYDKIEIEGATFYKHKKFDRSKFHTTYSSSGYSPEDEDIVKRIYNIVDTKMGDYLKKYTSSEYPEEKRIAEDFDVGITKMYFLNNENKFVEGEDIYLIVSINATPSKGDDNYWKKNFSSNELFYDGYEGKYFLRTYCFVRLSKSEETTDYEIAYIGAKPENYDQYISEFKENKGVDLENLDIEKILNTEYIDKINVVSSSTTSAVGAEKTEYNSSKIEQISNTASVIRMSCVIILLVIIILYIVKKSNKRK